MKFSKKFFIFLLFFLIIPALAAAERAYVSDQLNITFRRGKSTEHKILKTLKTGTPVEVLEREEGDKYVKVRLQSGEEGYVLGQYLTNEIPKPIIISRLEKQIEKLREQLDQAKTNRAEDSQEFKAVQEELAKKEAELKGKIDELDKALKKTKEELQIAKMDYKTLVENSAKVVEITSERDRLQKSNNELSGKVQILTDENSTLKNSKVIRWFLAGAGVLFVGWILGKLSRRKQRGLY